MKVVKLRYKAQIAYIKKYENKRKKVLTKHDNSAGLYSINQGGTDYP